ncbi:MAG: sugar transferase [Clostridiales bacterium]|nr:sugar transferase [Clostridiales bacterium]
MKEFLQKLVTEWWGIAAIAVVALVLWLLLSALFYRQFFKRFYDIAISGTVLLIISPILLLFILIGWIKMKGNPFFVQLRPGKKKRNGKERIFKLLKFRTMTNVCGEDGELLPDEQRVIKYGQWLRSTSVDELPSLINIFLGHLSIVGPRPQLVRDMTFMTEEQRKRHNVRPGLTGLAQVNGRNNITWEKKFEYDLEYIDGGISLLGDIKIIFKTVGKVLKRSDTVREGTVSDIDLGDYLLQEGKVGKEEYDKKQAEAKEILRSKA